MATFLLTPAFCKHWLLQDCLEHLYRDGKPAGVGLHAIVDNHYPVDKTYNRAAIAMLAARYDCLLVDSGKDLGLHRGLNNALTHLPIKDGDYLVGCDPDDRPTPGFAKALTDVLTADPSIAVACCNFGVIEWRAGQGVFAGREGTVAGHRVWRHPGLEMWNVAAFRWDSVREMGGFHQPNAYYGGFEGRFAEHWTRKGQHLAYLPDVRSDSPQTDRGDERFFDQEYMTWKQEHLAGFTGSFEEWLGAKAPHLIGV